MKATKNSPKDKPKTQKIVDQGTPAALVKRPSWQLADKQGEWLFDSNILASQATPKKAKTKDAKKGLSEDLYSSFSKKIGAIRRLSEEEERLLGLKIRDQGDVQSQKKLVLHNMRLALKMAHQYRRSWSSLMDLVQEASAGMAIAAERWDPDKGTRFGTYAAYWIRAQITKFLMTNSRLIHTGNTRAGRKVYFNLPEIRRQLLAKGEEPTIAKIAEAVQEDPQEVALIMARLSGKETSLSTPIDEENATTLQDTLSSPIETPESHVAHREVQKVIQNLIERFEKSLHNERDLAIWNEHLIASEPVSLVELGKRYGVSKQRMGQLATRIKRSFRRHIIDTLGPKTQLSWLFRDD
jgi:RNA polymerase sigma-32 factor